MEIRDLFDWVGGTSTGGMLALALIYGMLSSSLIYYSRTHQSLFETGEKPEDNGGRYWET